MIRKILAVFGISRGGRRQTTLEEARRRHPLIADALSRHSETPIHFVRHRRQPTRKQFPPIEFVDG